MKLSKEQKRIILEINRINHNWWSKIAVVLSTHTWPVELITLKPKWWSDKYSSQEYNDKQKIFMGPILFYLKQSISPKEYWRVFYTEIMNYTYDEFEKRWTTDKYAECESYYSELRAMGSSYASSISDMPKLTYTIHDS